MLLVFDNSATDDIFEALGIEDCLYILVISVKSAPTSLFTNRATINADVGITFV